MERAEEWIVPGKNRQLQRPQGVDRRVKFGKARRETFLEHLAATCNVTASAAVAEVSFSAVYRCRMRDAEFRAAWQAAIEQGYARLEAALIARATRGDGRPEVRGDKIVEGPDAPETIDWDKAMELLKHHQRGLAGRTADNRPQAQRVPIEVVAAKLVKRIKALGVADQGGASIREGEGAGEGTAV